jgi:hypothetical protein
MHKQQNRHYCAIYRQVYKIVCRSYAIYQQEMFSDHADALLRLPQALSVAERIQMEYTCMICTDIIRNNSGKINNENVHSHAYILVKEIAVG